MHTYEAAVRFSHINYMCALMGIQMAVCGIVIEIVQNGRKKNL